MKKFLFLMLFTFFFLRSFSQWGYGSVNFDDSVDLFRISIDTSVANNIWQIGAPDKSVFASAHSLPNAIVTDTLNTYPINNNSVFYFRTSGDYNTDAHDAVLEFRYKMDSDTLNDYGKIEISLDTGITWQNFASGYSWWAVYDTFYNVIQASYSSDDTIVFTGRTNGWYIFSWDVPLSQMIFDSILYRFTFHSSDLGGSRDGWMIDDIWFNTWWESLRDLKRPYQAYPNPATDQITIRSGKCIVEYNISNSYGRLVRSNENLKVPLRINVSDLPPGLYIYKIKFEDGEESSGKFVKIP
jgi:hypothetical protein